MNLNNTVRITDRFKLSMNNRDSFLFDAINTAYNNLSQSNIIAFLHTLRKISARSYFKQLLHGQHRLVSNHLLRFLLMLQYPFRF